MKKIEDVELKLDKVLELTNSENRIIRIGMFDFPLENGYCGYSCSALVREGWEHVALDLLGMNRCPTYEEMCQLKQYFFLENEVVLQVHPKKSEYVNFCPYRLHLWRKQNITPIEEKKLKSKIIDIYHEARKYYSGERKEVFLCEHKVLVIFCGDVWLTWEEVCEIKQRYWEAEESAIQFNVFPDLDLNSEHMILLWDAGNFDLPPSKIV